MFNQDRVRVENSSQIGDKKSAYNLIPVGKDLVALLRDSAVLVLAVLLLVFPTTFNTMLSNAGFEEGSFVGFKWKPKLLETDEALIQAQATITELGEQNEKMSKALREAQAKLNDPALNEQLAKLEEKNSQITAASSRVENSVASTLASNASLVEQVQNASNTTVKWGVVFSGDTTLDMAKYEVESAAPKLGIPNASVYLRQGSYRSVSVLDSRTEAQRVLPKAKQRRPDAYIVNMANWCPNSSEKNGFRECVSQ